MHRAHARWPEVPRRGSGGLPTTAHIGRKVYPQPDPPGHTVPVQRFKASFPQLPAIRARLDAD